MQNNNESNFITLENIGLLTFCLDIFKTEGVVKAITYQSYKNISPTYRIKLKASKKPVILEYVTAEAIAGTTLSVLSGSFLSCKTDFIANGIDAKLLRE